MADFSLNVKINGVEQAVTTVSQIEEALIATRNELKNVAIGSTAFENLSKQAQTLQREFVNSYKETTNFNKGIAELGQSMGSLASTVTAGFTIATTAFSMFGDETEELSETQVKAQQALSLALAATTLATNAKTIAEDINNVGLALQNGLTKLLTLALGANTVATAAQAVATGTATVAQRALNAAMSANPIGLVIAAVAALVSAFFFLGKEEKKTIDTTELYNEALDRNSAAIRENIATAKELAVLEGRLAEASAKTDEGKLNAKIETQKRLTELNKQDLAEQEANLKAKMAKFEEEAIMKAKVQKAEEDRTKEFNTTASDNTRVVLNNRFELEKGFLVEKQVVTEEFRKKAIADEIKSIEYSLANTEFENEENRKKLEKRLQDYRKYATDLGKVKNDQVVADKEISVQEQLDEIERQRIRTENAKKAKDNRKKVKEELEAYNKDVEKLETDRLKRVQDLERQLRDFILDRISLVKGADGVFREDLIAGYDETIAKIKEARDRSVLDEKASFEESLKSFRETESKKVDNKGKRIIADATIDAEILKRQKLFEDEQIARAQSFNDQIVLVEEEKAGQILQIDNILKDELVFGDNNLADSRKQLAVDDLNNKIMMAQRTLELEKKSIFDRIKLGDEEKNGKVKTQMDMLKTIQGLQAQQRVAERAAIEQNLLIQKEQTLKTVQGTEEQKNTQRLAIEKKYQEDLAKIKEDYALKDKEADRKNLEDIQNLRNANLQKWTDLAAQVANAVLGVFSAFNELAAVNSENYLRQQRDLTAQQTDNLNEEYNAQRALLDEKLAAGVLSQQQYNQSIKSLDKGLTDSTKALNDAFRAKELAEKKKAFESDKKLKIAQAVISGLQGAVSAFTGAFVLGPIAGPIVGGILAALVATTTAVQVAAISKTKFDGGAPEITAPNTGGTSATDSGAAAVSAASSGGFTGFNESLTGNPSATGATGTVLNPQPPQRVYVLESDITDSQRRVSTLESNASFG